jgi:hypothetical protein
MVGDLDLEFLRRLAVVVNVLGERWGRGGEEGAVGSARKDRMAGGRRS